MSGAVSLSVDQNLGAGARRLHQADDRRALVQETFAVEVPGQAVGRLPQQAEPGGRLVAGVIFLAGGDKGRASMPAMLGAGWKSA